MISKLIGAVAITLCLSAAAPVVAQDRLPGYPGAKTYAAMAPKIREAVKPGTVQVTWNPDSKGFDYTTGAAPRAGGLNPGPRLHFDLAKRRSTKAKGNAILAPVVAGVGRPGSDLTARGAYAREHSYDAPSGDWKAFSRGGNLYLAHKDGSGETALITDGSVAARIRNGVPTYVYTEELAMGRAIWWSPDGRKLAWMRFDESKVPDYPLQMDQTQPYSTTRSIAYPSPGSPNPQPDLFVYDLARKSTTRIDVRAGQPFSDAVLGHYIWSVAWAQDGSELRLRRANRLQSIIEWSGCSPATGACRTIVREEQKASWATLNAPRLLADNKRFILTSERNGWDNFYLFSLDGTLINPITRNVGFEVGNIVRVDEAQGLLWYMARDGDNFMKMQLHRVSLDGTGDVRLTDSAFTHAVSLAPDGKSFVDTYQTHDTPPASQVISIGEGGKTSVVAKLADSDLTAFDAAGLRRVEMFTFTAADGKTPLNAMLSFPHDFDPARKYPVLVSIYGGPNSNQATENFTTPDPMTEYGFLVLKADLRSASGRGKAFIDAIYGNVGQTEVDDQAQAVKALYSRPYVDRNKVGIFGTSYGGSMAAWSILRYPDVFQAAVSNSPVTDHRLYDSTYSERYMGLFPANEAAYARTSAMTYAANLRGALMIYYGTADDNVHPKNAMQLIAALQKAGKHFEVQVGPDKGHTSVDQARMMEFFIENLVLPPRLTPY
jgi:dipeptidyl-peptidase-4